MTLPFPSSQQKPLTISALTDGVKALLEFGFADGVWVTGEVSNLSRPSSGHVYLKLKDAQSRLNAVAYRGVALRLRFDLQDGMEVIARGRLSVYAPHGEYQLQIEELQPRGIGPLELALRQLREKLSARGYFDPARKKRLPRFPRRVVLITSPTGASVRDMLETLLHRWPGLEVWIRPVPVQGDGAGQKIAEAIAEVNTFADVDVVLVGRGGGSLEDLWAFNEEVVADAIRRSRIPIVSGIGHETDLTIADLVADVRGLTPTDAAVKVTTPELSEVVAWLEGCEAQLKSLLRKRLELARVRLNDLAARRCFRQPLEQLRELTQRLDELDGRMTRAQRGRLQQARQALEGLAGQLASLSPLNVLSRGYSLTRRPDDSTVLRDAETVQVGERLETRLHRGRLISRVEEVEAVEPSERCHG